MMEWDEIDEERADLIIAERLAEENVKTYSDKEVRNVQDDEELVVDEDDGWEWGWEITLAQQKNPSIHLVKK